MTGLVLVELDLVLAGEPSDRGVQPKACFNSSYSHLLLLSLNFCQTRPALIPILLLSMIIDKFEILDC